MTIRRGHRRAENGAWEIGTTKTDNSRRTVPLTASTVRALRAHKIASPYSGQRDLVFPNSVGRPLDPGRYRRAWADVCTAAGFVDDDGRPTRVPHELRHSVGSHGIDAGATVAQVADQLGNTPETVWRYYRHRTADVVDAGVADVMENLVTRKVSR
jgi:integrase